MDKLLQPYRIAIVGTSGSGKSTLALEIAEMLSIRRIEMDCLHWEANWKEAPRHIFLERIENETSSENWVCDGNYSFARHIVWDRTNTLVWLNYPFFTTFVRTFRRSINRIVREEHLFGGNTETFRRTFFSSDSILLWVLRTYHTNKKLIPSALALDKHKSKQIIVIKNNTDRNNFLSLLNINS